MRNMSLDWFGSNNFFIPRNPTTDPKATLKYAKCWLSRNIKERERE
jgi:hypothetical protein